jgi:hypothetical protein
MPHDELRNAVHAIGARLQADFEAELGRLEERLRSEDARFRQEKEAAVEEARQQAEARAAEDAARTAEEAARTVDEAARTAEQVARAADEAARAAKATEDELTARLEASQAESARRLESIKALEDTLAGERTRAGEFEAQRDRLRAELEGERDRLTHDLEDQHRHTRALTGELEQARTAAADLALAQNTIAQLTEAQAALTGERDAAQALGAAQQVQREADHTAARAEERLAQLALVERLLSAVRTIDAAKSLGDTLTALTNASASMAPRVALFVVSGREVQGWRAAGFDGPSPATLRLPSDDGSAVAAAAATTAAVATADAQAPAFAALPPGRAGLAVPVTVGGQSVAVLYADDATGVEPEAPASWPEALQILAAHASARLSYITALRTSQAMRAAGRSAPTAASVTDDESSARRYARLLVSEIKLYNESAVRLGREKRDLMTRLGPEIERARRLFEERVPTSLTARTAYFMEELVHTLADGDSELLGSA